jgi:hypothetical protein
VPEFVRRAVRSVHELRTVTTRALLDDLAAVHGGPAIVGQHVVGLTDTCSLAADLHPDVSVAFVICGSTVTARALQAAALRFPANVAVVAIICNLESEPAMRTLGDVRVVTIALLDDLRHIMVRGGQS